MILFIDNYDSFTYNLVGLIGTERPDLKVVRNDALSVEEILALDPDGIVLSPGPGRPAEAGVCPALVLATYERVPILGVCLGHQVIVEAFGGTVERASNPMHGKTSPLLHDGDGLFEGLPRPLTAGRYHSLVAPAEDLPSCLSVKARSPEGEVMAVSHRNHPCHGVQFHPESILTPEGPRLLHNFLALCPEANHA